MDRFPITEQPVVILFFTYVPAFFQVHLILQCIYDLYDKVLLKAFTEHKEFSSSATEIKKTKQHSHRHVILFMIYI